MPSLTAQQRQTAIDAIIHMEGTDGSNNQYGPTKPGWGGGNSALSYGQFQNDISQGENKYDVMSSSQALLEMLENYNDDRTLDEKIVTHGSNPAGAKAIRNEATPTDKTYYNIISSALSAPENLPIWQAQDSADENSVIDKLNEAINYINDKNPDGSGSLSWSHLDPKALMALAVWTNQHQNIMPMVEALTAGASSTKPLTTTGLLDAIYQQPYF
jgi:hypothetical protein